jgi:hypothetical protein
MVEALTNKNGEDVIQTSLRRTTQGLLVTVKTHPKVEEFMQRVSGGEVQSVSNFGRNWLTEYTEPDRRVGDKVVQGSKHIFYPRPLRAYAFHTPFEIFRTSDGTVVDMEKLGYNLMTNRDDRNGDIYDQINLSFIRLQGVSEENGVQFLIKTVYSLAGLKKLRDGISAAQNTFAADYLKTIEYCVTTATQSL